MGRCCGEGMNTHEHHMSSTNMDQHGAKLLELGSSGPFREFVGVGNTTNRQRLKASKIIHLVEMD